MKTVHRTLQVILHRLDDERFRFVLVGGWNTLFGYLAFAAVLLVGQGVIDPLVALVIAYAVALPQAFIAQKLLVFRRASGAWAGQFARFSLVNTTTFFANALLLAVGTRLLPDHALSIQAAVVILLTIVSFVVHKTFSFAERR